MSRKTHQKEKNLQQKPINSNAPMKPTTRYGTLGTASRTCNSRVPNVDVRKGVSGATYENEREFQERLAFGRRHKKLQNLLQQFRRKAQENQETVALWTRSEEDISPSECDPGERLKCQKQHRRGFWKGLADAMLRQFYFMTVSIENSGGVYRATTVTAPDGTVTAELHYCQSSPYATVAKPPASRPNA